MERRLKEQEFILGAVVSVREVLAYIAQDKYLTLSEAAVYTRLGERTIRRRLHEIRPRPIRVGNRLLFKKSDLDQWMETYRLRDLPRDLDEAVSIAEEMLGKVER